MTWPKARSARERAQMLWNLRSGGVYGKELHDAIIKLIVEAVAESKDDRIAEIAMAVQSLHEYVPGRELRYDQILRRDALFEAANMIFERFLKGSAGEEKQAQTDLDKYIRALIREELALDRKLRGPL